MVTVDDRNRSAIISVPAVDMVVARRYLVTGLVQGVGFRFFAAEVGRREGVRGFVRNLADGRVEAVAEADRAALERFERSLYQGPPMSRVDHVTAEELAPSGRGPGFVIRG